MTGRNEKAYKGGGEGAPLYLGRMEKAQATREQGGRVE